jgi:hypothetical protein
VGRDGRRRYVGKAEDEKWCEGKNVWERCRWRYNTWRGKRSQEAGYRTAWIRTLYPVSAFPASPTSEESARTSRDGSEEGQTKGTHPPLQGLADPGMMMMGIVRCQNRAAEDDEYRTQLSVFDFDFVAEQGSCARTQSFAWSHTFASSSDDGHEDVHGLWRFESEFECGMYTRYPTTSSRTKPRSFARRRRRRLFGRSYWQHWFCLPSHQCGRRSFGTLCACVLRKGGGGRAAP